MPRKASPNPVKPAAKGKRLPLSYFRHHDVVFLSQDLLGKVLMTKIDGQLTGGIITETEAYRAPEDKASHAFGGRRTQRNEVMYAEGGFAYVYLCYGLHNLFNIVTNEQDIPHAILIRAIQPLEGIDVMLERRGKIKVDKTLAGGPGTVCQALGIKLHHNGLRLDGNEIWIEDRGLSFPPESIKAGPRVGVDYAGEDAFLPWRFWIKL